MAKAAKTEAELGELLQSLVNRISHHGQGKAFAIMNEASVTVAQVVLLHRVIAEEVHTPSDLAHSLGMSGPAVSQMLERLSHLGLIARMESLLDRRQKLVIATPKAKALLKRIGRARGAEYAQGVAPLPAPLRDELRNVLTRVLAALDEGESDMLVHQD